MSQVAFKKIVEWEHVKSGKRYRKVTEADAKKRDDSIRDIYESAPGKLSFGEFVPVQPQKSATERTQAG